jgi:hypothetical protein
MTLDNLSVIFESPAYVIYGIKLGWKALKRFPAD